jgi:hypothetical protein
VISFVFTIHAGLGEHRAGLLIGYGQQMRGLPVTAGMAGAPDRLAVHRQRPPRPPAPWPLAGGLQPRGEPGPYRGLERISVHRLQDPADGGLIRRLEPAGQRITPDPGRGQDLQRGVGDPFADRSQRLRPGQHRCHRCQ